MIKVTKSMGHLAASIVIAAHFTGGAGPASAKELSEKSVTTLMGYAWSILPAKFTTPNGKVIEVDKKNKQKETMVPVDTARDVIKVGYLSAQAQLCELWEDQVANYDAMIAIERAKKNWSDQQLLYITTLHRMTIHMAAGRLKVTEKDGDQIVSLEPIEPSKDTCNAERKQKVKEAIEAYAKTAPKRPPPAAAPAPAPAAKDSKPAPSQPVPAAQKK